MTLPYEWQLRVERLKRMFGGMFGGGEKRPQLCPACGALVGINATRCHECGTNLRFGLAAWSKGLSEFFGGHAPATTVILITNVVMFGVSLLATMKSNEGGGFSLLFGMGNEALYRLGASNPYAVLVEHQWWRLITACFVHIGVLHLIVNMFALAMMGPLAELLWGRRRLLLIYLISGLAGSALAMAIRPDSLLAGASGAIWGIQMSLFAWLFTFRRHLPADLAADWFRRLSVVFVLNAGVSFLPGISWEGHLGGGVAGFLAAGLLNAARFGDRPRRNHRLSEVLQRPSG